MHLIFQIVPPPHLGRAFLFTQQQHDHSIVSNKQSVALQKKNLEYKITMSSDISWQSVADLTTHMCIVHVRFSIPD